jgi:HAD superfamily hydrolase (TIGR01509 family)
MKQLANLANALNGKRLLIFDFDGTVADTSPLHAAAFSQVLAPLGIAVDYPSIAGMKTLDAMLKCLLQAGRSLPHDEVTALAAAKQESVRKMIGQALLPLPGVDDFLRWAKPRYQLAMVTSGSRKTLSLGLEKLGYTDWFSPLICADDLSQAKPDPEGFVKALQLTGVPADEALVFEDSQAGFLAASAADLMWLDARTLDWSMPEQSWS